MERSCQSNVGPGTAGVVVAGTRLRFRGSTDADARYGSANMRPMGMQRFAQVIALLAILVAMVAVIAVAVMPNPERIVLLIAGAVVGGLAIALGLLVARGEPRNIVAVLLAWHGFNVVAFVTRDLYYGAASQGALPLNGLAVAFLRESAVWLYAAVALLLVLFPNGRVPGPRWRLLPPTIVFVGVAFQLSGLLDPAPFPQPLQDLPSPLGGSAPLLFDVASLGGLIGLLAVTVLTATALVAKFRRSVSALERAQLKWLSLAGIALPAALLGCLVEFIILGKPEWFSLIALLIIIAGVPAAMAIAILRHDLYDVDKAIAGIVVYGAASGALLAIYASASFAGRAVPGARLRGHGGRSDCDLCDRTDAGADAYSSDRGSTPLPASAGRHDKRSMILPGAPTRAELDQRSSKPCSATPFATRRCELGIGSRGRPVSSTRMAPWSTATEASGSCWAVRRSACWFPGLSRLAHHPWPKWRPTPRSWWRLYGSDWS